MKACLPARSARAERRRGIALFAVLAVLAGLTLISTTVFVMTTTEIRMAGNYQRSLTAFYTADAGVNYVKSLIESDLASGSLALTNAVEQVNYAPGSSGLNFKNVTNLTRLPDRRTYLFELTGRATNAETTIQSTFYRISLVEFGVFGDQTVDLKANGSVYSYRSDAVPNPTSSDSTGEADVGCNEDMVTHVGTYIDGDLVLGEDPFGNSGSWLDPGSGSTITGETGVQVDRVDPDPLGAIGGDLAAAFTAAASANNNAHASPPIPATRKIQLGNSQTMTLTSGVYYVSLMDLGNGASLTINNVGGPVTIYLTGGADFKNGSSVNILGSPTDFFVYSNSSQDINLYHNGTFKGFLYAPFADVEIKNSGDFYGIAWADSVDIKNSGNVYIDLALTDKIASDRVRVTTWKEVRPDA